MKETETRRRGGHATRRENTGGVGRGVRGGGARSGEEQSLRPRNRPGGVCAARGARTPARPHARRTRLPCERGVRDGRGGASAGGRVSSQAEAVEVCRHHPVARASVHARRGWRVNHWHTPQRRGEYTHTAAGPARAQRDSPRRSCCTQMEGAERRRRSQRVPAARGGEGGGGGGVPGQCLAWGDGTPGGERVRERVAPQCTYSSACG